VPHRILFYDYVPDVLERRGPFREEHLARIAAWRADGRIVMAGALGDPVHGAAIVFGDGVGPEEIEEFASDDPYVVGGIVRGRRVEPWNVV
jgi:uncharacterized protein